MGIEEEKDEEKKKGKNEKEKMWTKNGGREKWS